LPAKLEKEGLVAVPESVLMPYVMSLVSGGQKVVCEAENSAFKISCGNKRALIKTLPHDEFPAIPRLKDVFSVGISSNELLSGLRSVLYCAAVSSTKPELSGILMYTDEDTIVFAATDAFRLAERKIQKKGVDAGKKVLIPYKNALDLIRMFDGFDEDLVVLLGEHQMSVSGGGAYFTTRLIDASFPDYTKLFPIEHKSQVTILRSDLASAMKTAQIFSDKFSQVAIRVSPKKGFFEVNSKGSDYGDHNELVDAALEGEDVEMRFNWRYVLDCLNNLATDSVTLRFYGPGRPITVQGVGDTTFVYLLMPMNVSSN
jgi:DNA polymerase-3 subunit beta